MSRFSKVQIPRGVSGNRLQGSVTTKLAGLDMVTPVDEIREGRTPEAKNFRLYEESTAGREVAVTTRKGPMFHTYPLSETGVSSNESTDGASTAQVGVVENTKMQPFTVSTSGRLSRIDVKLGLGSATTNIRIDVYDDEEGRPGNLLTRSSFLDVPDTPEMTPARFVNATELVAGNQYWFVLYVQDDGIGEAVVETSTSGPKAFSGIGMLSTSETDYSVLHKVYVASESKVLGSYRFNREDGVNRTLVAYNDTMYVIDDDTNTLKPLISGLSTDTSYYDFTNGDGKVFWVNGQDELTSWSGTYEDEAINLIPGSSFDVDNGGWVAMSGTTVARNTSVYASAPASLRITGTSGRGIDKSISLLKNRRYKLRAKVRTDNTTTNIAIETITAVGGTYVKSILSIKPTVANAWVTAEAYFSSDVDINAIRIYSATGNYYVDDIEIVDTGIEYVINNNLPKLWLVDFHKDRLFGVPTGDRNRLVFSENPGNPSDKQAREQWYNAWLSVSFIYIPRPKNGSPITAIIPFQDNLVIFTQDKKYILSGTDRGNFFLREATGNKGALHARGVVSDPNYIYFTTPTGVARWNGSADEEISALVKPLFDKCPDKWGITLGLYDNTVRVYMNSQFSTVKDITAIFSNIYNEWMLDTDTYVEGSLYYDDADDQMELIEFSSVIPIAYHAEQDFSSLGAPIDFDYRLRYDSRGIPGQRKKFKRYVPLIQSVGKSFPITYGVDKDFEDSPREKIQQLNVGGAEIGDFFIDDGTILTGATAFKAKKTSVSGYSHYMQFRVKRYGVNNQVAFMGVQFTYKAKKL